MSGLPWTKFYWSDWESDPALRLCSYAAQGLWMRMLCIASAHDPIGYVAVAGRGLSETDIARTTGGSELEVRDLLGELDRNGVFSRDRTGRIYSRRMVGDAKKAAISRKNGKLGGNPRLGKGSDNQSWDNPADKGGLKTQKPEARVQKKENPPAPPKGDGQSEEIKAAFDGWNEIAGRHGLPVAMDLTDRRRKAIAARLKAAGPAGWTKALEAVERSAFLTGQRQGSDGRTFRADLDFVCQAKSFQRLREGYYGEDAKPAKLNAPMTLWPGPADFREAVIERKGEAFARSYLDPCGWLNGADRHVLARTTAAQKALLSVGDLLDAHDMTVRYEARQ